ncbi:MAG TPA: hypothetical protein DEQ34_14195 [Balneolaceae bacterium]|nr:hypothetical protein [Balneolaceae bacterium]|tara:strand:+ start:151102 stop:151308 length:207 start_codon:yes stop_codon:yes gene_type:complete
MKHRYEKEYHPIVEEFIADYVDNNLDKVERETFEEVLVHDDDIRELAFSAKEGKEYLELLRAMKELEQ